MTQVQAANMTWWYFSFRLVTFLAVNGLVTYAAFAAARTLARGTLTKTEVLATAIVLVTGQIVLSQILLGLLGLLTWGPVMGLNGLLASGLLLAVKRRYLEYPLRSDTGGKHSHDQVMWGMVLTIGVIMLINLRKVLGMPPFGSDSLGYHLPMAVEWLQTGRILIQNGILYQFYPGTSELVDLWLLFPFRDNLLVNLQNWPLVLLAGLALYNLARRAGVSMRGAVYSALFFISIRAVQVVLAFENFQDNDILVTAFFLTAINLGIAAVQGDNRWLSIAEGVALGLLIGTKYSGLGYAALAGVTHVFFAITQCKTKWLINNVVIIVMVTFLMGGFWYMRNWIAVGNPLRPVTVQIAGLVLFPGRASFHTGLLQDSSILDKIAEPGVLELFIDRALLGQGGFAVTLAIPVLIFFTLKWGYGLVFHRQWSPLETVLHILLPWGAFGLFITTPLAVENAKGTLNQLRFGYSPIRFGLSFWALGGFLLAGLLFDKRWRQSWVPDVFAVLVLVHSFVTVLPHQLEFSAQALSRFDFVAWLALLVFVSMLVWIQQASLRRIWHWPALALILVLMIGFVLWPVYKAGFSAREHLYEHKFPGYATVHRIASEQNVERINLVGYTNGWFAFSDDGLTIRVIQCPNDLENWFSCISTNQVELVVFEQRSQTTSASVSEATVVQRYPGRFTLISSNDHVHIYRAVE